MVRLKDLLIGAVALLLSGFVAAHAQGLEDMSERVNKALGRVVVASPRGQGTGTGFVISRSRKGGFFMVTNHHVVNLGSFVSIVVGIQTNEKGVPAADQTALFDASVVAISTEKDLAVLHLTPRIGNPKIKIDPLSISTATIKQGLQVSSFGFPGIADKVGAAPQAQFFSSSMTTGVISRLTETSNWATSQQQNLVEIIQHDAEINRGNSGGPLTDSCSHVVGVNTNGIHNEGFGRTVYQALVASELVEFLDDKEIPYTKTSGGCSASIALGNTVIAILIFVAIGGVLAGAGYVIFRKYIGTRNGRNNRAHKRQDLVSDGKPALRLDIKYALGGRKSVPIGKSALKDGVKIGREADIAINDEKVSRVHAVIFVQGRKLGIKDLNARNGTFVDGEKLSSGGTKRLYHSSVIRVGDTEIRIAAES